MSQLFYTICMVANMNTCEQHSVFVDGPIMACLVQAQAKVNEQHNMNEWHLVRFTCNGEAE